MRTLVTISGISKSDYGVETVQSSELYPYLKEQYDLLEDIRYQHIMDRNSIFLKTLADPLRLVLTPSGKAAQQHVSDTLEKLSNNTESLDVLTHSLGSWIIFNCKAKIKNLYLIASPLGWCTPLLRSIVKLNVGKPKIQCENLYYIYSRLDPVSNHPDLDTPKTYIHTNKRKVIITSTTHNLSKYLNYLHEYGYEGIFKREA